MKKFLPLLALCAVVGVLAISPAVQAEDPKSDTWDNDSWGFKVTKPKDNPQWKFLEQSHWKEYFDDSEDKAVFALQKWQSDNLDGNAQKSPPLVSMFAFRYGTQDKIRVGDWEGTPGQGKSFAKALFDAWMKDFKDPKNIKDTDKAEYPFGKVAQFSCYATSKKYGGAFFIRVIIAKADSKNTYEIRVTCPPGEELPKKSGTEIETILRSIKFYEIKK